MSLRAAAGIFTPIFSDLLGRTADTGLPDGTDFYAVAYRPVVRDGAAHRDVAARAGRRK